jgi:hypothetical protein
MDGEEVRLDHGAVNVGEEDLSEAGAVLIARDEAGGFDDMALREWVSVGGLLADEAGPLRIPAVAEEVQEEDRGGTGLHEVAEDARPLLQSKDDVLGRRRVKGCLSNSLQYRGDLERHGHGAHAMKAAGRYARFQPHRDYE